MRGILYLAAVVSATLVLPAHAATRTWVSGKGADQAGCGAVANPCRTLQFAHDLTAAGGEIDILDPAGYGAVAVTKSISIINDGVGVAGLVATSSLPAVSIETKQPIAVILRGLTISATETGSPAVTFVASGSLTIQDCLFRNSGGLFVSADAPSSIQVLGSTFLNSFAHAIIVNQYGNSQTAKPLTVVVDRTTISGSGMTGIRLSRDQGRMSFAISRTTLSANQVGIWIDPDTESHGAISNNTITQNQSGVWANSVGPSVALTGNVITGNYAIGVESNAGPTSFGDNKITGNGTDVSGYFTTASSR